MIAMLITNMNGETCINIIDNTVTSNNENEASDINKCTSLTTSAEALEISNISESIILNDDDDIIIIEEGTEEKRSPTYENDSKKRKVGPHSPVEEIVFNYLTGIYEKMKKIKSESEDEIHEEMETSTDNTTLSNNFPGSDQSSQSSTETDCSGTINYCKMCQFKTVSKQGFKLHLFRSHLRGKYWINYNCTFCNSFNTTAVKTMFLHQIEHKMDEKIQDNGTDIYLGDNVKMEIVSKDTTLDMEHFQEIEWLESISHSVYGENVFKCFDCTHVAKRRDTLQNHVIQHKNSNFTCNKHLSLQKGCLKCVYKCYLLMLPYKLMVCSKCNFKTCQRSNYLRHNRFMHNTDNTKVQIQKDKLLSRRLMLNRKNREEIERLQSIKSFQSAFKCFDCEYVAKKREAYQNHVIRHENSDFTCDKHLSLRSGCPKCAYKSCLLMLPYKMQKCKCGFKTCRYNHYVRHIMEANCIGKNKVKAQESIKNQELVKEVIYSCKFCNFKTEEELEFYEHQSNIDNCGNSEIIILYSDSSSEDEECVD